MICRLFIFSVEAGVDVDVPESKRDCKYCKDADNCINCEKLNMGLTKESFSWTLARRIVLPEELQSAARLVGMQSAIEIIHPTHTSFWIAQIKNEENEFTYAMLQGKSKVGAKSIGQLNFSLRKDHDYDGRDIEVEDFEVD
jgi:hypothetical protein